MQGECRATPRRAVQRNIALEALGDQIIDDIQSQTAAALSRLVVTKGSKAVWRYRGHAFAIIAKTFQSYCPGRGR